MDEVFSVTTSVLAVYLLFRLASFSKNLLKEDDEELFVLLTALCSAGRCQKLARIQANVAFWGNWKVGLPLLTPLRAGNCPWTAILWMLCERTPSTVNNSDILDSPFQFFEAWLPGTAGRARFPTKIIPPKNHTFCLFRVN